MSSLVRYILLAVTICIIIFTQQFPNYLGYKTTPPNTFFTGQTSWFDPWDINVYVTAIKHGQEGNFLLINHYNTIEKNPALIYPVYTILGNIFSSNPFLLFHVFAALISVAVCLVIFHIYKNVLSTYWLALAALIVCVLAGGFGWIPQYAYHSAANIITSFNFVSVLQRGHEGIGVALYIIALYYSYVAIHTPTRKYKLLVFFALLLQVVFYPYYLLSYTLITAAYTFLHTKSTKLSNYKTCIITTVVIGIVTTMYYFHLSDSAFAAAAGENLRNVSMPALFLGYGNFILFFAISHYIPKHKPAKKLEKYLLIWVGISILLSYLPNLGFSRFFLRGLFFPLTLLVFLHLDRLKARYILQLIVPLLISIFIFSRMGIFMHRVDAALHATNSWIYMPQSVLESLKFLENTDTDGVISSSYEVSNLIPAYTNKRVYFGHLLQTPNAQQRTAELTAFYSMQMSTDEALAFLQRNNINLVHIYDTNINLPDVEYKFLKLVYQNQDTKIFTVNSPVEDTTQ